MSALQFATADELASWLASSGVPVEAWGQGDAKRLSDLWDEYHSGETAFADYPPRRLVAVVQLRIARGAAVLLELAQELADGRRRVRMRLPSEKMKAGETPHAAARRGLREELGLEADEVAMSPQVDTAEQTLESPSYPGLGTLYTLHTVHVETAALPDHDFWRDNATAGDPVRRHRWGWRPDPG